MCEIVGRRKITAKSPRREKKRDQGEWFSCCATQRNALVVEHCRDGGDPQERRLHGRHLPLETLRQDGLGGLIGDNKGEAASLLGVGHGKLDGGGRGGRGGGRGAVESVLVVDILLFDGGHGGLRGLNGALDDGVVGLDFLISRRGVLGSEDGAVALAGHSGDVKGVGGTLGQLGDGEDAGLVAVEAVPGGAVVGVVVDVEHREVELGLGNHGHADLGGLGLRELEGGGDRRGCRDDGCRGGRDGCPGSLRGEGLVLDHLLKEGSEGLVPQEALDECAGTGVLLRQSAVLIAELVVLLDLDGDLTFELANVFYIKLVSFEK